jgi:hypothetical protein
MDELQFSGVFPGSSGDKYNGEQKKENNGSCGDADSHPNHGLDRLDQTKAGYRFTASLETNLQAQDMVVATRGTTVYGRLTQASSAGRVSGSSDLTLELTDVVISGTAYPLLTSTYEVKGKGEGGSTAKKVVGGAGLGALIGGIAGGGKGAGIGALAGVGTLASAAKKGQQVQIPKV